MTKISTDAVIHTPGIGARWVFNPTQAGPLWFDTVAALRGASLEDLETRLQTSLLMLDYRADETAAAAALIADYEESFPFNAIRRQVRDSATTFTAADNPNVLTNTMDPSVLLYRLAAITTQCRAGLSEYRITYEMPYRWGNHKACSKRLNHWKPQLRLIRKNLARETFHATQLRLAEALQDATDTLFEAVTTFEHPCHRLALSPHVRVCGDASDIAELLHGVVKRCGLAFCLITDRTVILRCEDLPIPVAVRLFDGLAAEFPHLTFEAEPYDEHRRFQGGCRTEAEYHECLATLEPLFFTENVAPVSKILRHQASCGCWQASGRRKDLRQFVHTFVSHFGLSTRLTNRGKTLLLCSSGLSDTAVTQLIKLAKRSFPTLSFHPAKELVPKRFSAPENAPLCRLEYLNRPEIVNRAELDLQERFRKFRRH